MASRFSVESVFKAIDRVSAPVSRMQNRVGKFTRSMTGSLRNVDRMAGKVTAGIKRVGLAITAAMALTGGAMADVISTGATFEQTLVNAAAKFPGEIRRGTEAFELLENAARKTGSTTEFTASQSAEALNFLAMAGFDATASVAALPGVVDLATAAQVDLGTATDIASDSLGSFNLITKDAAQLGENLARVNDVIAKTTTSANTNVEDMFEAIKDGGPVATTAGASLETFAALVGELANSGIKGTRAGTTLKNMFLKLAAPSKKGSEILGQLGVKTADANGDLRDIVDILGDLNNSLDGLGTAERSGLLEGIFGKIPIAGVNILLASGSKRLNEYREQIEAASGSSTKMAAVMRDTVQGRLNSLNSAIEGVKISIFSMNNTALAGAIDKMTEWVRTNEEMLALNIGGFFANIINNFGTIVTWIKRIGIGLAVFFTLVAVLKSLIGVLTIVNLLMMANPITLIVLGVLAAVAAFAALVTWIDQVVSWFENLPGPIRAVLLPLELVIRAIKFIKDNFGVVADLAQGLGNFLFGDDDDQRANVDRRGRPINPQVVSPSDRVAKSIEEKRETSEAEITIKDETGRASVTRQRGQVARNLQLQQSGSFD